MNYLELAGYIAIGVLILLIGAWLVVDILIPLFCRAFTAFMRWYLQGVINGK